MTHSPELFLLRIQVGTKTGIKKGWSGLIWLAADVFSYFFGREALC